MAKPNKFEVYESAIHHKFETNPFRNKQSLDACGLVKIFLLVSRDWIAKQFQKKTISVPVKFDLYLNLTWNG